MLKEPMRRVCEAHGGDSLGDEVWAPAACFYLMHWPTDGFIRTFNVDMTSPGNLSENSVKSLMVAIGISGSEFLGTNSANAPAMSSKGGSVL